MSTGATSRVDSLIWTTAILRFFDGLADSLTGQNPSNLAVRLELRLTVL